MRFKKLALILPMIALLGNSFPVYAAEAEALPENTVEAPKQEQEEETAESDLPEDTKDDELQETPNEQEEENVSSVITGFQALPEETAKISYEDKPSEDSVAASLPQTLTAFLDESEEAFPLPVTWECSDDYAGTDYDVYVFLPVWDETLYSLSPSLSPSGDVPSVEVSVHTAKASVFLVSPEHAQKSLAEVVNAKDVLALVYLCDSYTVKQEPGKSSADAAVVTSGQSVQITGIGEDSMKNIWYKVSFDSQGTPCSGYIERDYLAFSDEDLISFEYKYVSNYLYRTSSFSQRALTDDGGYADINKFPESYRNALTALKKAHPNWIFVNMNTGLDWSNAVASENSNNRSLIHSSANAAWKEKRYDSDANWYYPTNGILAYYMDPRNFLSDNYVFQFELLSYNATYHTETAVQGILDGTFMSGAIPGDSRSYAQAFRSIGSTLNVSPFHLASRVRQEQGAGKSPLISGSYPGYEGLYNYFNIGATGTSDKEVIEKGLSYAKSKGWTSCYLSLNGGANIISQNYIQKRQDTLYLQKFNVDKNSPSGIYNHQYMQNIAAPSSEAANVKKAYAAAGSIDKPFVFRIPVYDNMPYTPCTQPAKVKEVTLSHTSLSLKADASVTLTAYVDGNKVTASQATFKSDNPKIASVDKNGKVTALSAGSATITCSVPDASAASLTVTVEKIPPAYTLPSPGKVTYNPSGTLGSIALPAGWAWDKPDTVPTVVNAGYPATFTPSDTAKYETVKETVPLTVEKGTPSYKLPDGLQTAIGNTLASIKLPAGFSWEAPATVLSKEGTVSHTVSYNPDTTNYNTVAGITVKVTVTAKAADCVTHSFGEWETSSAATCTAAGKEIRSCLLCGYQESRTVSSSGHSYTSAVTKEPTQTQEGIRTYTCSKCKDTYTEAIAKLPASHKHSYTSKVTKEAGCTTKGVTTYTCSCGDTYTEDIPAAGHSYTSKVTKEATEKETGVRTYTCGKCGDAYTEAIAKLPASHKHNYASAITKVPSCTEQGLISYTCSCGDTYTEKIPSLGHDMADGKCRRCGYKEASGGSSSQNTSSGSGSSGGAPSEDTKDKTNAAVTPAPAPAPAAGPVNSPAPAAKPVSSESKKAGEDKKASQTNVTIDMKNNTVLYEEALSAIRGQDIDVVLNMGSSISWTINGSNIVADEANGIDMGVQVNQGNIPSGLLAQAAGEDENNTVIELSLSHDGPFSFGPILTINTAIDNAGRTGNLFYYQPDSRTLEFMEAAAVSKTGDLSFTFSHASDYAVVISDASMEGAGIIQEAAGDEADALPQEAPEEHPDTVPQEKEKSPLSTQAVILIVLIVLVCLAIGVTAYFLLVRKDGRDVYEGGKKETDNDCEEEEEYLEDLSPSRKKETADEFDAFDEEDFIDDYREPETPAKKTGKVISLSKRQELEEDEFDGFE